MSPVCSSMVIRQSYLFMLTCSRSRSRSRIYRVGQCFSARRSPPKCSKFNPVLVSRRADLSPQLVRFFGAQNDYRIYQRPHRPGDKLRLRTLVA